MDSAPSILVETEEDFWRNKFYDLKTRYVNLKRESRERSSKARKLILATAIKLQEKENEIQNLRSKHDEELAEICRELTLLQSRMLFERKRISELLSERAEIRGKRPGSFRKKDSYMGRSGTSSSGVPLDIQKGILKSSSSSSKSEEEEEEEPIDCSTSILENLKRSMKIEDGKDSGRESDESLVLNPPTPSPLLSAPHPQSISQPALVAPIHPSTPTTPFNPESPHLPHRQDPYTPSSPRCPQHFENTYSSVFHPQRNPHPSPTLSHTCKETR